MSTRKEAAPPPQVGGAVVEEEQAEKELDQHAVSLLCRQHCDGVPASYGIDGRKSAVVCTAAEEYDDGSGEASTAGKCQDVKQQADHYKCQ